MSKDKKEKGNVYDKIFKENAEPLFIPLIEECLAIKILSYIPLREKMQTTIEREMDFFYEVHGGSDQHFILHIEFQTKSDPEMLYRAAEYHGMALRRKRLPIRHIVVNLSETNFSSPHTLPESEIFKGFDVINVNQLNASTLLNAQIPEVMLLAVLGDYPREQSETILRLLISRLRSAVNNPSQLSKYLSQLVIIARLRKLEDLTIKITEEMPIHYNIETDYLYLQGLEKGIEKEHQRAEAEKKNIAYKMLKAGLTAEQVAAFLTLPIEDIEEIVRDISN